MPKIRKVSKELQKSLDILQKSLDLQLQPIVQDEGSSIVLNMCSTTFRMIKVEGGTFLMGAQNEDPLGDNYHPLADEDNGPVHRVTLDSYYIGETVVTQGLWRTVMGDDDCIFMIGGDDLPAVSFNWYECQRFIKRLNKITGLKFRLPTEAEWEFAARGGNKSRGYAYSGSNEMNKVGWTDNSRDRRLHPVKMKRPNELGIYDMSGNVWEWCSDRARYGYPHRALHNPKGPASDPDDMRVIRGGSWDDNPLHCLVFERFLLLSYETLSDCGLRLAMDQ